MLPRWISRPQHEHVKPCTLLSAGNETCVGFDALIHTDTHTHAPVPMQPGTATKLSHTVARVTWLGQTSRAFSSLPGCAPHTHTHSHHSLISVCFSLHLSFTLSLSLSLCRRLPPAAHRILSHFLSAVWSLSHICPRLNKVE